MSTKRIFIGPRPSTINPLTADEFVKSRREVPPAEPGEPMKRLTIDVPDSLHRAIKGACASRGTKMADELREMLLQKYGNQ